MSKHFLTLFVVLASPVLLAEGFFEGFADGFMDAAKEKLKEEVEQFGKDKIIKEGQEFIISSAFDKSSEIIDQHQENLINGYWPWESGDSDWSRFAAEDDSDALQNSIDRFFTKYNSPSKIETPLEIHFQPREDAIPPSLLEPGPSHTSLPSFSKSTRPIDYVRGGNNAAKGLRMHSSLKSLTQSSVYRYLIGLETTSPLIASAIKQLQSWANQLNAMSVNSYEMATATSGAGSKAERAKTFACEHERIATGDARDWIAATYDCQDGNTRQKTLERMSGRNGRFFVGQFDVADKIFSLMGLDKESKRIFLNITGTVRSEKSKGLAYYPSLVAQVVNLLQNGEKIEHAYNLKHGDLVIEKLTLDNSEKERISDLLKSIQKKLVANATDFCDEEKQILGSSRFPVATLIAVMTQYKGSGSPLVLERYSSLLAFDRVMQFMEGAVQSVLYKAESLRAAQISGFELDEYIRQVHAAAENLQKLKNDHAKAVKEEQEAIEKLLEIDEKNRSDLARGIQ